MATLTGVSLQGAGIGDQGIGLADENIRGQYITKYYALPFIIMEDVFKGLPVFILFF